MKAVKAVFQKGALTMLEDAPAEGPVEVLVVFPNGEPDPWDAILSEPTPRASFVAFMEKAEKDIAEGKTEPLDLNKL